MSWKRVIYPQQQSLWNKHSDYVDEMNGSAFLFVLLKVPFVAILILFHRYREWEFNHPPFLGTIRNGNVLHCSANGNVLQHQEPKSKFVCWFCKQKFIDWTHKLQFNQFFVWFTQWSAREWEKLKEKKEKRRRTATHVLP